MATNKIPAGLPVLRTSERTTWRSCPQKWWWGYRQGLVPKGPPHYNFWFGTGVHLALAEWYLPGLKRGPHPAKTWEKYCDDEFVIMKSYEGDKTEYHNARDLGTAMLEHYVDVYGKDRRYYVLETERTRKILIRDHDGTPLAWYFYTMDGVVRDREDGNRIKLLENKTAAMIITTHLAMDDQAGSYLPFETENLRAEGILKPDEQIEEIVYNILRKAVYKEDDRPQNEKGEYLNKDGSVSKNQGKQAPVLLRHPVTRTAEYRRQQVDRIISEVKQMQEMRADRSRIYKNPQQGPFGCSSCPFFEMCKLHEEGADWAEYRDWTMTKQDPYATYRKAA